MGDYISREAARKGIYNCPTKTDADGYICVRTKDVAHMIDDIPAADVRPAVRGRWIKKGCYAVCSNCGERIAIAWTTTVEEMVNVYRFKFCNNCGADMREVKVDG